MALPQVRWAAWRWRGGGVGGGGSARSRINSSLLYQRLRPELKRLNLSEPQL